MLYYTFATFFAQIAITLRLVTPSVYLVTAADHTSRVYAVTGKNRWIASCLSFTTFAQVAFGTGCAIYYGLHPGTIFSPALRSKLLRQTQFRKRWYFPAFLSMST